MSTYNADRIRKAFEDYNATGESGYRHFAVLVPVTEGDRLLYEVRAAKLDRQPGEVCFPGGLIEEGETPLECALRETEEEVGISPDDIEIVSRLDSIFSTGGSQIHCFLGIVKEDTEICPNPQEVEEVFQVETDKLAGIEPEMYESRLCQEPDPDFPYDRVTGGRPYPWRSGREPVPVYETADIEGKRRIIWGLTGRITKQFMEVLKCSD
ncbi:MAG: CoA pyrophosphatase [Clostridia bacterium]|nr:CoA pyrophosphatase [Clostridia bacterium]